MSWFTSRYTRSLEEQVKDLRTQLEKRDAQIERLETALATRPEPSAPAIVPKKRAAGQDEQPKVGNWLRSLNSLERASDTRFERHEPEPEPQRRNRNEE